MSAKSSSLITSQINHRAVTMEQLVVRKFLAAILVATCSFGASAANLAPTVSTTAPAANATFVAPAAMTLSATAADSDGTITKVAFYKGSTLLGNVTTAPYNYSWTNVAAGTYSITTRATDNLGAVTISAPLTVTVKANVLPTVALTQPVANASYAAPGVVALAVNAADSDGTLTKVVYFQGATQVAISTAAPFAASWSNVAIGNYSITAKAYDDKGGITTSAAVPMSVKANVAPTISITTPVSPATFYVPGTLTLAANAVDSDGTISQVVYYNGATVLGTVTQAPFTFAWVNPAPGSYSITAKATDNKAAVTTSTAVALTVKTAPVPTVSVTNPVQNARFVAPSAISISAAAAVTGDTISKVEYISSGNLIGTATTAPYTINLSNVAAGNYEVSAKATGTLGGTATSALVSLSVAENVAPQIALSTSQSSQTAPAVVTLNATATDTDGTVAKVEFFNGATLLGSATQAPYSFVWNDVAAGTYAITARATDNLGLATTTGASSVTVGAAAAPATTQVYYIHSDQINTAREIANAAGAKVWEADPEPFGANLPNENPTGQGKFAYNARFPGQYYDTETGLHYNYHRDYDSQTGRYVQSDPIGLAGGINTYSYVGGNPVSYSDPLGLKTVIVLSGGILSNPFGHIGIATTGAGVFSYGTAYGYGSSLTDYVADQLTERDVTLITLNTTPEQEKAIVDAMNEFRKRPYSSSSNNCAHAVVYAMGKAGIGGGSPRGPMFPRIPSLVGQSQPGATTQTIYQGGSVPPGINIYNPK